MIFIAIFLSSMQIFSLSAAKEDWGYVNIRKDANMFWWLYHTTNSHGYLNSPLVMWLQGGPGGSSTGFGNFGEIGPQDVNLNPRNTTWLKEASLLFVDNPVGTGYSYVTDKSAYTTNNEQIADDLVALLRSFLNTKKDFKNIPFYIFSESYGGKMTVGFAYALNKAIKSGLKCNFKGFAMGDSWISPSDFTDTWGSYLYATSVVDDMGKKAIDNAATSIREAISAGKYDEATSLWSQAESVVESVSNGVDFYNILNNVATSRSIKNLASSSKGLFHQRHLNRLQDGDLNELMNGAIRKKLKIIPKNVTWGGQAGDVFQYLSTDFMKPVYKLVDYMLENSTLKVIIYNGQLDLICDTLGTETWLNRLKWTNLEKFRHSVRSAMVSPSTGMNMAYRKHFKNLYFYWILKAGHMVPVDAGGTALRMLAEVTGMK